jgi:hypothetical protein
LYVLPLLKENKIVQAFHSLINKVRGRRQEDIDIARDNLAQFRSFDMSVDIHIAMNTLVKLFSAVNYTTGSPMPESEMMRKFSQCVFQDERMVMHNTLLDSMARGHTYQESVDNLYRVMDLLPIDKQRLKPHTRINDITTGTTVGGNGQQRKLFCYSFQFGSCKDKDCQLRHEIVAEAAQKADSCSNELGENDTHAKGQDSTLKQLDAIPDGEQNINFYRGDHQYDPSTDQLYEKYIEEFRN